MDRSVQLRQQLFSLHFVTDFIVFEKFIFHQLD